MTTPLTSDALRHERQSALDALAAFRESRPSDIRHLPLGAVADKIGFSPTTIRKFMTDQKFPRGVQIGGKNHFWTNITVHEWQVQQLLDRIVQLDAEIAQASDCEAA
ncbi:helix-turn-helix transcriptional regulator [Tateyamaria sp.]|uniref:helix-turn-helix transcriptional regulator n=1 Tax=Tateyamaria sp. TaxID=1929288 RepID=UPI0032A0ADE1